MHILYIYTYILSYLYVQKYIMHPVALFHLSSICLAPCIQEGSQISLVLDAHHLDLMFSDFRDPPCAAQARAIE